MWKFLCKIFGCQYDRHSYWSEKLRTNVPDHHCIFCGELSEWSRKERIHLETHVCTCGAWVDDSGVCSYH